MELHQLEYFVAVVEMESFSKAAKRCNITQPSLSQQIINLEKELGHKLFNRLGRRITITEAGKLLYPRACSILSDVRQAKYALTKGFNPEESTLSAGIIPTLGPYLLHETVSRFQEAFPDAILQIREDMTNQLVELLMRAELDVAFISLPIENDRLILDHLFEEELYIAIPQSHNLATNPEITPDTLQHLPLIRLSDQDCLSDQLDAFCHIQKITPSTIYQTSHLSTVIELVQLGIGISLVPACSAAVHSDKNLVFRPMSNYPIHRTIIAARHQNREVTSLSLAFARFLREAWQHLTRKATPQ